MIRHSGKSFTVATVVTVSSVAGTIVGVAVAFLMLLLFSGRAHAQAPRPHPASDRAAVAVYERYLRAVGPAQTGPLHTVVEVRMGAEAPTIRTETYLAPPNRLHVRATVGGEEIQAFGHDGTTGWASSPATGLVRVSGAELATLRESVAALTIPRPDATMRLISIGRSTFDGQDVDGIAIIRPGTDTARAYYSRATGLLVGAVARQSIGAPRDSVVILFRDYQRVGTQQTPMTILYRGAGMNGEARTTVSEIGAIDPARFKPPAGLP